MIIFLLIIFLIIFIPIPLKTSICYSNQNYYIKIYNFKILRKNKASNNKKVQNKSKEGNFKRILKDRKLVKAILINLNKSKFKPYLSLKGKFCYSLKEHPITAVAYGLISAILPFIYKGLSIPFKIIKFKIPVCPDFKEVFFIKLNLTGILFISIGQIIYILLVILKTIISEREKAYYE
jgi:hypothetical protein